MSRNNSLFEHMTDQELRNKQHELECLQSRAEAALSASTEALGAISDILSSRQNSAQNEKTLN